MPAYRPIIYLAGTLSELPTGEVTTITIRGVASPAIGDVYENEIVIDTDNEDMILRLGNKLFRYGRKEQVSSYPGKLSLNIARNSHWIGSL
jgi:hypothetical protein